MHILIHMRSKRILASRKARQDLRYGYNECTSLFSEVKMGGNTDIFEFVPSLVITSGGFCFFNFFRESRRLEEEVKNV